MKTIIHINQHKIRSNIHKSLRHKEPVITVKNYKTNNYCNEVKILGESKVVYSPDKPLSCGARCWVETQSKVEVIR